MFGQLLRKIRHAIGADGRGELSHANPQAVSSGKGSSLLFSEELFTRFLSLERRRVERSRKPFALMLMDAANVVQTDRRIFVLDRAAVALSVSVRETDICGWYKEAFTIGVILTEIGSADANALRRTIFSKVSSALRATLAQRDIEEICLSFHVFPEDTDSQYAQNGGSAVDGLSLYPDLYRETNGKKAARLIKRAIDIAGSLTALILLSPLFLAIAVAIKLTSKGPILFKQKRIGQFGVWFTFLKFRSMYSKNDEKVHREYLRRFISGKGECKQADGNGGIYKLTDDSRITPVGKFLRRTSLDELPQFLNVLRGDMSLVGPRPPIPYEIESYDIWHRRRFLEAMPGITGLWQVKGRSKCTFDEMVRLDIKYARDWSLGLDLKILLETPRAVLFGKGAY